MPVVVVVGAGVSGLTSALLLAQNRENTVTVVAKHMPGDYDIEYASPWAGANIMPMATVENSRWERRTWPELKRLAMEVPEAGIHLQKGHIYRREKDSSVLGGLFQKDPWFKDIFDGYRELRADEVIPGHDSGCEVISACINTAMYLPWLQGQCLKYGVVFQRAVLTNIREAKNSSHTGDPADVVINCTGLGSLRLGGVEDYTMAPARGQIVLVRNEIHPMTTTSGTDDGPTELLYTMQRAAGGGTIIGGTYDLGNWESTPDPNIAIRMMQRAVKAHPQLTRGRGIEGLSVIRHGVGLRPYRHGGVRIDAEQLDGSTWLIHNYGHSGWGYQGSYGCAERVVELVGQVQEDF
ncbi:D-amino-acid oxidase-like protein [Paramyrothecium foliicola]|nr:D-amino-acid oxidase-like protein [Paramyrothecium foliicola]